MKKTLYFLLLCLPFNLFSQLNELGTPKLLGLGLVNAVTTDGDYQIGHFYNPAFLNQDERRFDVFSSYTRIDEEEDGLVFGATVPLNDRLALGIGYANQYRDIKRFEGYSKQQLLPISAAYDIYETPKMGVTIGVGVNFYEKASYINQGNLQAWGEYSKSRSYNIGFNMHRLFEYKKGHSMKLGLAGSVANYRRTPDFNIISNDPLILLGGMVSWKYPVKHYHYSHSLLIGILSTGYEGRFMTEDYYIALRGAILYPSFSLLHDTEIAFGGTFNYKGFYLDIGILSDRQNTSIGIEMISAGLGYQKALSN